MPEAGAGAGEEEMGGKGTNSSLPTRKLWGVPAALTIVTRIVLYIQKLLGEQILKLLKKIVTV